MEAIQIDLLSVALAAVLNMAIGFFWYSNWMFGKAWLKLSKLSEKDLKNHPTSILYGLIVSFVIAYFIAFFKGALGVETAVQGAFLAFYFWLGFVATTQISSVIWGNRPWALFFLDTGCKLLSFVVMGGVIGA